MTAALLLAALLILIWPTAMFAGWVMQRLGITDE